MAKKTATLHFEIVWTYQGAETAYGPFATEAKARREFEHGNARIQKLIHGGTLRLDQVTTVLT